MVSQKQNKIRWPEEETPSPLDHKQTSTIASWRGRSLLFRILGIVIPLVGGFALTFPINVSLPVFVFLLMPLVLGAVSVGLYRSWWAMLIVPVAYSIGFALGSIFQMGGLDLQKMAAGGFEGWEFLVFLGIVPVAVGVAIGTPIGKMIEQRLHQLATPFEAPIPEHLLDCT